MLKVFAHVRFYPHCVPIGFIVKTNYLDGCFHFYLLAKAININGQCLLNFKPYCHKDYCQNDPWIWWFLPMLFQNNGHYLYMGMCRQSNGHFMGEKTDMGFGFTFNEQIICSVVSWPSNFFHLIVAKRLVEFSCGPPCGKSGWQKLGGFRGYHRSRSTQGTQKIWKKGFSMTTAPVSNSFFRRGVAIHISSLF